MLEANPEAGVEYEAAEALPDAAPEAQKRAVADAKAWLQSLPLSRRRCARCRDFCWGSFCSHALPFFSGTPQPFPVQFAKQD